MTKIVSAASGEHYKWGGPNATDCDAWHLLKTPDLSIIEESMPPVPAKRATPTRALGSSSSSWKARSR